MLTQFPTPTDFHRWLTNQPPDTIIAEDWDCYTCPLAKWLGQGYAIDPEDELYPTGTWYYTTSPKQQLPTWAYRFASEVDQTNTYEPLTTTDCLRILEQATNNYTITY